MPASQPARATSQTLNCQSVCVLVCPAAPSSQPARPETLRTIHQKPSLRIPSQHRSSTRPPEPLFGTTRMMLFMLMMDLTMTQVDAKLPASKKLTTTFHTHFPAQLALAESKSIHTRSIGSETVHVVFKTLPRNCSIQSLDQFTTHELQSILSSDKWSISISSGTVSAAFTYISLLFCFGWHASEDVSALCCVPAF